MNSKFSRFLLIVGSALLLITACTRPDGTLACNFTSQDRPVPASPINGAATDSSQPTFSWSFDQANCLPDMVNIEVRKAPAPGQSVADAELIASDVVSGSVPQWTTPTELAHSQEYIWRIAVRNLSGPGSTDDDPLTRFSAPQNFWVLTDTCETLDPYVPSNLTPVIGTVISSLEDYVTYDDSNDPSISFFLEWGWPNPECVPSGYTVQVSNEYNLDQTDPVRTGSAIPEYPLELENCQVYYWQVRAHTNQIMQFSNSVPYSQPSLSYFITDYGADCPNFNCNTSDLIAPHLLSPAEGEEVKVFGADLTYQWEYPDDQCQPEGYLIEVFSGPSLDLTPLGEKFTLDTSEAYGPIPAVPSYIELADCKEYTWRVAALVDGQPGPFAEGSFSTNYSKACTIQQRLEDNVELAGLACLENDRMMASFRFQNPPEVSYRASLDGQAYECSTLDTAPNNLYCFGPAVAEQAQVSLKLTRESDRQVLFDETVSSPSCKVPDSGSSGPVCKKPKPNDDPCWIWFGEPTCQWLCFN